MEGKTSTLLYWTKLGGSAGDFPNTVGVVAVF